MAVSDSSYETIEGVLQAISSAESSIKINSDNISLKVNKNGIISSINQSPESISINANKINLHGVVTANENFKILTDGSMVAKNGTFSGTLSAAKGTFTGELQAATGTFKGNLSAAGGTFSGTISAGKVVGCEISGGTITSKENTSGKNISITSGGIEFYREYKVNGNPVHENVGIITPWLPGEVKIIEWSNNHLGSIEHLSTNTLDFSSGSGFSFGKGIDSFNALFIIDVAQSYARCYIDGSLKISQNLTCSGTKNRMITTKNYDNRLLYCYEMSAPIFGDIGEGETDENGECYIYLDDIFSETVNTKIEYQVFLQKENKGDVWVDLKTPTFFIVKGTPNLKFSWEIKAKQLDYEYDRLEEYGDSRYYNEIDYETEYLTEIKELINEQEEILYEAIE